MFCSRATILISSFMKTTLLQFSPCTTEIEEQYQYITIINHQFHEDDIVAIQSMFRNRRPILIYYHNYSSLFQCEIRVSTKWLNFLRKICAISAQIFFANFTLYLRMKRNEFCAVLRYFFAQFAQNRKYFAKVRMKRNFSFAQFFFCAITASFTQNVTF